jgi:hypothetical protein
MWPFPTGNKVPRPRANTGTDSPPPSGNIGFNPVKWIFSGVEAFVPAVIPGRILYTGYGELGLDNVAPIEHVFWIINPALQTYSHRTNELIQPGGPIWGTGDFTATGLMPMEGVDGGADADIYAYQTEGPSDVPQD